MLVVHGFFKIYSTRSGGPDFGRASVRGSACRRAARTQTSEELLKAGSYPENLISPSRMAAYKSPPHKLHDFAPGMVLALRKIDRLNNTGVMKDRCNV